MGMTGTSCGHEEGQSLMEYVLIMMSIVIVAVVVLSFFGNQVAGLLMSVVNVF